MHEIIIENILKDLNLDFEMLEALKNKMIIELSNYNISKKETAIAICTEDKETAALNRFFAIKKLSGLSMESLKYYRCILKLFKEHICKSLLEVTTDDVRIYLAQKSTYVSKTTLNNERRVLSSFYKLLIEEEIISKNPIAKVKTIKQSKSIKKSLTEEELEKLRSACINKRDKALIETMYSTGCRVGEVAAMKVSDIDLEKKEIRVIGKGNKERIVFISAKCKILLAEYLSERKAGPDAFVFTALKKSKGKEIGLSKGGIERIIKNLGEKAKINKVHPHKLRRTMATMALNKGMPIEEISQILGHESINTTTIYARTNLEEVKRSHGKYI